MRMNMNDKLGWIGLAVLALTMAGCGGSSQKPGAPQAKGTTEAKSVEANAASVETIKIDGSSTVFPVMEAVAEEFQKATKIKVTVGISGTGGGFKKFVRGETDISNASRPILAAEMEEARKNNIDYIELPICFDALTLVVHPSNALNSISIAELKTIWEPGAEGKLTKWSQVNPAWPDAALKLFGAGSDSGTFDYFTEAIVGKAKSSRGDYTASEDDNVLVQGVGGDQHALGYLPFAYYLPNQNKLKALEIDNGQGPVKPSLENVLNGKYNPLSRPLFVYVNKASADKPGVKQFVEFMLKHVKDLAQEVHYLPLQDAAYQAAGDRFLKRGTGTAFGGKPEVGVTVEELLKRELKS